MAQLNMINLTILNLSLEKEKCIIFMAKNEFFQIKPIQGDYAPTSNTLS